MSQTTGYPTIEEIFTDQKTLTWHQMKAIKEQEPEPLTLEEVQDLLNDALGG